MLPQKFFVSSLPSWRKNAASVFVGVKLKNRTETKCHTGFGLLFEVEIAADFSRISHGKDASLSKTELQSLGKMCVSKNIVSR